MGRKTVEAEVEDYLRKRGKTLDELPNIEDAVPDDPAEMLQAFTSALYRQMNSGDLKSQALVAGLKAIASLAEKYERENPKEVVVVERGIDEILGDTGLPRERRVDIGRAEIDRLRERTSALELVVAQIEGE